MMGTHLPPMLAERDVPRGPVVWGGSGCLARFSKPVCTMTLGGCIVGTAQLLLLTTRIAAQSVGTPKQMASCDMYTDCQAVDLPIELNHGAKGIAVDQRG